MNKGILMHLFLNYVSYRPYSLWHSYDMRIVNSIYLGSFELVHDALLHYLFLLLWSSCHGWWFYRLITFFYLIPFLQDNLDSTPHDLVDYICFRIPDESMDLTNCIGIIRGSTNTSSSIKDGNSAGAVLLCIPDGYHCIDLSLYKVVKYSWFTLSCNLNFNHIWH